MTAQPYPVCCGLGGGDRANSVQKQSHFKSRTYASHSSKKWLQRRQKHTHTNTVVHKLCPNIFNYFAAPVALRGRWMRRLLCVLDISTRHGAGATGCRRCHWLIQLLHKPSLQHRHSTAVCWVWRGHLDPIHVRNVMGVQLCGSPLVLRTDSRLDGPGQLGRD